MHYDSQKTIRIDIKKYFSAYEVRWNFTGWNSESLLGAVFWQAVKIALCVFFSYYYSDGQASIEYEGEREKINAK